MLADHHGAQQPHRPTLSLAAHGLGSGASRSYRSARFVTEAKALGSVAGNAVLHDVSERSYQFARGGGAAKGKSCDSFALPNSTERMLTR